MNVETISMDPRIAAIHYKDYRKKVREARAKRIAAAQALNNEGNRLRRQSAKDLTLIEKEDAIAMACYREMAKGARIDFARALYGAELSDQAWRRANNYPALPMKAQVPSVPAHLRPAGDLEDYHILFEAKWEKAVPPDPLLLKHISGHMYSVLAQWDLTDVEKAVLEGRFG